MSAAGVSLSALGSVAGSGSSGAGGGVVSIVHPIHPDMTSMSNTKSSTGMPTANAYQCVVCSPGIQGEKNITK